MTSPALSAQAWRLRSQAPTPGEPTQRVENGGLRIWAHACEGAFAAQGDIANAFAANAAQVNEAVIDEDSVATAIAAFMRDEWTGSATELMSKLKELDSTGALMVRERGAVTTREEWPPDATRFSGRIEQEHAV
jgi:hypothetical protein